MYVNWLASQCCIGGKSVCPPAKICQSEDQFSSEALVATMDNASCADVAGQFTPFDANPQTCAEIINFPGSNETKSRQMYVDHIAGSCCRNNKSVCVNGGQSDDTTTVGDNAAV